MWNPFLLGFLFVVLFQISHSSISFGLWIGFSAPGACDAHVKPAGSSICINNPMWIWWKWVLHLQTGSSIRSRWSSHFVSHKTEWRAGWKVTERLRGHLLKCHLLSRGNHIWAVSPPSVPCGDAQRLEQQLILSAHLSSICKEVRKLWEKHVADALSAKWPPCRSPWRIRSHTGKSCIQVFTCRAAAVPLVSGAYTVLRELFTMRRGLESSWKPYCFFALAYRLNILHKQSHVNPLNTSCLQASRGVNLLLWRPVFPGEDSLPHQPFFKGPCSVFCGVQLQWRGKTNRKPLGLPESIQNRQEPEHVRQHRGPKHKHIEME